MREDTDILLQKLHDPDIPVSLVEAAKDIRGDEKRGDEARRLAARNGGSLRLVLPHKLPKAEDHAHHLRIFHTGSYLSRKLKATVTTFRAICEICRGEDHWATAEAWDEVSEQHG